MRPAELRLAKADDVTISARTAALLTSVFGDTCSRCGQHRTSIRNLHTKLREFDGEVAVDLDALLLAAARWRERQARARAVDVQPLPHGTSASAASAEVETQFELPEVEAESELLDTEQVADLLHVTSRAVRLACEAGRLRGQKDERGRWWIDRDAVRGYQKGA